MDMWHTVIQCTVVLGLSLKDTCLYPNTLPIWSLPRVEFLGLLLRDLTPFLIHFSRAFTFHHYFIFLSFLFHTTLQQIFIFLHTTMMHMKCNEITYHHLQMSYKILTNPNINKITMYAKISFILNNPNNFNNQIQLFSQLNYQKHLN